jgi:hypothetical protein
MATWEDVSRIALSLPEATEQPLHDLRSWRVRDKLFVWERPLRRSDLRALGDSAPTGPILGARVEHLVAKEALIADDPDVFSPPPTSTATRPYWCGSSGSRWRNSKS